MEVCDVCRKTLEKEKYTISVRKGTYYNRWECCSEKCLGVAVEKEKIKIPVTTAYQEVIKGEQAQATEKFKKVKKRIRKKPSKITVSDVGLVFSIITLIIVIISNFALK